MSTAKILGNTYIINGQPTDSTGFIPDMSADVYYEVVRLSDRKVLFLDDHLERLRHSVSGSGLDYPGDRTILDSLRALLVHNDLAVGNIRICLHRGQGSLPDILTYFIPYYYPDEKDYFTGVRLASYSHERPNPGIKKWDNAFRISVAAHIREQGVYEAVLVNEKGEITEGSRSNIFFIDRAGRLVTPPEKDILPGITRKYVMEICKEPGIEVTEQCVRLNELDNLVSCFISGTSPKVLPVRRLDSFTFRVDHPLLKKIMEQFGSVLVKHLKTIV
jgi:branched-chain amino acid aminotransferase